MSIYKNHVISTQNERKTSGFGKRIRGGKEEMHKGVDIVDANGLQHMNNGTAVLAFESGKVAVAKDVPETSASCGNYVDIAHDAGGKKWLTRYMHMRNNSVRVKTGDTTANYTDTVHQASRDGKSVLLAKIWSWVWTKDCERA